MSFILAAAFSAPKPSLIRFKNAVCRLRDESNFADAVER